METHLSVNFDHLTIRGASRSFGMYSQVVYKSRGRGAQLRVKYAGEEETWLIPGGEKIHVVGHVAHFTQR